LILTPSIQNSLLLALFYSFYYISNGAATFTTNMLITSLKKVSFSKNLDDRNGGSYSDGEQQHRKNVVDQVVSKRQKWRNKSNFFRLEEIDNKAFCRDAKGRDRAMNLENTPF
jgi:hypothetical protein